METRFQDRHEAGQALAEKLKHLKGKPGVIVLALPRGGVPVGFEIACELNAPLDIFLVRKLGVPQYEELAMGAIASGGILVLNEEVVRKLRIPGITIDAVVEAERGELERREQAYRQGRPALDISGCTVILVDDGLATGATMRAAARALRRKNPQSIIVAAPVGAGETCDALRHEADQVICPLTPADFHAVGACYHDFTQTTDEDVCDLLDRAALEHHL